MTVQSEHGDETVESFKILPKTTNISVSYNLTNLMVVPFNLLIVIRLLLSLPFFVVIFCFVFQATTGLERVVGPIEICLVFVPINSARERKSDSNDVSNLWRDWRLKVYKGGKKKAKVTD